MTRGIRWARWPIALLAVLVSLSFGLGSALAAPRDNATRALALSYQREKKSLQLQDQHLTRLGAFADKAAAAIEKAKTKGKDTTALEQALATFRQQLTSARADWQAASSALSAHAGFDGQGKVTDAVAARATITSARDSMLKVHQTMENARKAVRDALKAFRKANREASVPDAPAAPPAPAQG